MNSEPVVITDTGMVSSVGITARQTTASLFAGVNRQCTMPELYVCKAEDPEFEDGTALVAAPLSYLDSYRGKNRDPARWIALIGSLGFSDLMDNSGYNDERFAETGLFLSLPPLLKGACNDTESGFIYHFHNRIEKDIFPFEIYTFEGHTGVFRMIDEARAALAENIISCAIVGGVESCLFPEWLERLDDDYRIKSTKNIDGYVPGEMAAFLIMEKHSPGAVKRKHPYIIEGSASTVASGLQSVLSELLTDTDNPPIVFGDLNGESKRMEEWGYARTGLGQRLGDPVRLEHPADALGDMGAASGAVLIAIAMDCLRCNQDLRQNALIFTASDGGERRAIKLARISKPESPS